MSAKEEPDSEEVITGEITAEDGDRTVRVYKDDGDFILTLPEGCRMTFGYFNPGQTTEPDRRGYGRGNEERRTALRIYGPGGDKNQLAAFLGVKGFRDESIKLKKIVERVTVERRLVDDGEGNEEHSGKRQVEITARAESSDF